MTSILAASHREWSVDWPAVVSEFAKDRTCDEDNPSRAWRSGFVPANKHWVITGQAQGESVGLHLGWSVFSPCTVGSFRAGTVEGPPECIVGCSISMFMELKPGEC